MGVVEARAAVLAIEHLIAELVDEVVPAGELRRIVKSVRQSVLEGDRVLSQSPALTALVHELTIELLDGKGNDYDSEDEEAERAGGALGGEGSER